MSYILIALFILALGLLDAYVRYSHNNLIHNWIWRKGMNWTIWTKSIIAISVLSEIIDGLFRLININIASTIFVILFIFVLGVYITFARIVFRNIMSLRPLIGCSVIIMAVIFMVYLIIGAKYIPFNKSPENATPLLIVTLCYLPTLTVPFIIGYHRMLVTIIKDHKEVFNGQSLPDILSPMFLNFISMFSVMATFASLLNNYSSSFFAIYVYMIIYVLAPISIILIIISMRSELMKEIREYGVSSKINTIFQKYINN